MIEGDFRTAIAGRTSSSAGASAAPGWNWDGGSDVDALPARLQRSELKEYLRLSLPGQGVALFAFWDNERLCLVKLDASAARAMVGPPVLSLSKALRLGDAPFWSRVDQPGTPIPSTDVTRAVRSNDRAPKPLVAFFLDLLMDGVGSGVVRLAADLVVPAGQALAEALGLLPTEVVSGAAVGPRVVAPSPMGITIQLVDQATAHRWQQDDSSRQPGASLPTLDAAPPPSREAAALLEVADQLRNVSLDLAFDASVPSTGPEFRTFLADNLDRYGALPLLPPPLEPSSPLQTLLASHGAHPWLLAASLRSNGFWTADRRAEAERIRVGAGPERHDAERLAAQWQKGVPFDVAAERTARAAVHLVEPATAISWLTDIATRERVTSAEVWEAVRLLDDVGCSPSDLKPLVEQASSTGAVPDDLLEVVAVVAAEGSSGAEGLLRRSADSLLRIAPLEGSLRLLRAAARHAGSATSVDAAALLQVASAESLTPAERVPVLAAYLRSDGASVDRVVELLVPSASGVPAAEANAVRSAILGTATALRNQVAELETDLHTTREARESLSHSLATRSADLQKANEDLARERREHQEDSSKLQAAMIRNDQLATDLAKAEERLEMAEAESRDARAFSPLQENLDGLEMFLDATTESLRALRNDRPDLAPPPPPMAVPPGSFGEAPYAGYEQDPDAVFEPDGPTQPAYHEAGPRNGVSLHHDHDGGVPIRNGAGRKEKRGSTAGEGSSDASGSVFQTTPRVTVGQIVVGALAVIVLSLISGWVLNGCVSDGDGGGASTTTSSTSTTTTTTTTTTTSAPPVDADGDGVIDSQDPQPGNGSGDGFGAGTGDGTGE